MTNYFGALYYMEILKRLKNKKLLKTCGFVAGRWTGSNELLSVINPCNGSEIAYVNVNTKDDVELAIKAASKVYLNGWKSESSAVRSRLLREIASLNRQFIEDLALIMSLESGKPFHESKGEIKYSASYFEWAAEETNRLYGDIIPDSVKNRRILVEKEPVGVCAFITPWNFPSAMLSRKVSAGLASGCSIVAKPASETPLSALALCEIFSEAVKKLGLPEEYLSLFNVVNMSSGRSNDFTDVVMESDLVRKVSFTGSTNVGKLLMKRSAKTLKKLSLELGGNAPFIVFNTLKTDIERQKYVKAAVKGILESKFRNSGQTCVCLNRLYVEKSIFNEVLEELKTEMKKLVVGDALASDSSTSALISSKALKKCSSLVEDAVEKGARIEIQLETKACDSNGNYFSPTLLSNCSDDMKVMEEEIFGPIIALSCFDSEEEVVKKANDTEFGLASYFFSDDVCQVTRVKDGLQFGMVGINTGSISTAVAPFGGIKHSGFGREGSKYGLDDFTVLKYSATVVSFD